MAVLAVRTAPNDGDPLAYELTRAAFWRQQHGVGAINAAYDSRLDQSPPHAEMGQLATMLLSHSDRFVALGQFTAVFALALGVAGVGRRIGLVPRQAAFGALLVPFFPVVLAQSWTGFTDIVFAAFLVAACYFALGASRVESCRSGSRSALRWHEVPRAAAAPDSRSDGCRGATGAAPGLVRARRSRRGGLWRDLVRGKRAAGERGARRHSRDRSRGQPAPIPILGSLNRYALELLDLSGAIGSDVVVFAFVGLMLAWIAAVALVTKPRASSWLVAPNLIVGLVPFAVIGMDRTLAWLTAEAWDAKGGMKLADVLVLMFVGIVFVWVAVVARMAEQPAPWWLVGSALLVGILPFAVIRLHWMLAWLSARAWDADGSTQLDVWFGQQSVQTDSDGALCGSAHSARPSWPPRLH